MKNQDIVCPECGRTVRAHQPRPPTPLSDGYYYPAWGVGVLKIAGYTWVRPYQHKRPEGDQCIGSAYRYYVGDGSL